MKSIQEGEGKFQVPTSTNLKKHIGASRILAMPLPGPISEIVADLHASNEDGDGYLANFLNF